MYEVYDLHTHSTASDGTLTPSELIQRAAQAGVKAIALAKKDGEKAYEANYENVLQKKYPLGRMLYLHLYVAKAPNKPLPKMTEEFLKYVLSKAGQEIVIKDGYLPLPAPIALKQLTPLK